MPRKVKKTRFSVTAIYKGDYSPAKDAKIDRVFKSHGGRSIGSGYGMGERDIQYDFPDKPTAETVVAELKKLGFRIRTLVQEL